MPKSLQISLVAKGILLAAAISFILTLFLSLVYYFSSIQESSFHSLVVGGISVLVSSIYISYLSGSKGIIYGLAIGLGFFLVSVLIYYIFYVGNPSWEIIAQKLLLSLLSGAIGGTLGAIVKR